MEEPRPDPDALRMLAFQAGDAEAFDQLFERWAGPLLRYLERMVGDVATAEELVQDTFLRVHGARDRYEPRARFSTFLYRIATNLALNELKRPRRRATHTSADHASLRSPGRGADEQLGDRRARDALVQSLDALPERQRVALWLSAAEGCSHREIAEVLATSEKSVKALIHRARVSVTSRMRAPGANGAGEHGQALPGSGGAGARGESVPAASTAGEAGRAAPAASTAGEAGRAVPAASTAGEAGRAAPAPKARRSST